MKRIFFLMVFAFLIIFPNSASAKEEITIQDSTPSAVVKYDLAYPGMLPDHPLYKLKVLRDKITTFLIQDPMKKAEYHLLLADKRIHMSKILVEKGKIELAKETALKGENEYTLLVFMFKDVGKKPSKTFFDTLQAAALKHQEILNEIVARVGEKDKKTFETVIQFSKRNADELKTIYQTY